MQNSRLIVILFQYIVVIIPLVAGFCCYGEKSTATVIVIPLQILYLFLAGCFIRFSHHLWWSAVYDAVSNLHDVLFKQLFYLGFVGPLKRIEVFYHFKYCLCHNLNSAFESLIKLFQIFSILCFNLQLPQFCLSVLHYG